MAHEIATLSNGLFCFAQREGSAEVWHANETKPRYFKANATATEIAAAARGSDSGDTLKRSRVRYATDAAGTLQNWDAQHVIFWESDGHPIGVVSEKFQLHYRTIADAVTEAQEHVRALKGDISAAALLKDRSMILLSADFADYRHAVGGSDEEMVTLNLNMGTAFNGTLNTTWNASRTRAICANTWGASLRDAAGIVRQSHRSAYSKSKTSVGLDLEGFAAAMRHADAMTKAKLSPEETADYLARTYLQQTADALRETEETQKQLDRVLRRVLPQLASAPGSHLATARGTVWGAFNAVTHDVDHMGTARNDDNRAFSAQLGTGAAIKARAWENALALAA